MLKYAVIGIHITLYLDGFPADNLLGIKAWKQLRKIVWNSEQIFAMKMKHYSYERSYSNRFHTSNEGPEKCLDNFPSDTKFWRDANTSDASWT